MNIRKLYSSLNEENQHLLDTVVIILSSAEHARNELNKLESLNKKSFINKIESKIYNCSRSEFLSFQLAVESNLNILERYIFESEAFLDTLEYIKSEESVQVDSLVYLYVFEATTTLESILDCVYDYYAKLDDLLELIETHEYYIDSKKVSE